MVNIEHLASESLLNEPIEIVINGEKMKINKPTVSTLIAASKYIGKLPEVRIPETVSQEVETALAYAGEYGELIGQIIAILFLGKKNMYTNKAICGISYKRIDNVKILADKILNTYTNKELYELLTTLIGEQGIAFFLNIIISLSRVNLLKTKKTEMTTHGL